MASDTPLPRKNKWIARIVGFLIPIVMFGIAALVMTGRLAEEWMYVANGLFYLTILLIVIGLGFRAWHYFAGRKADREEEAEAGEPQS